MKLTEAKIGTEYVIGEIVTDDEDLDAFLFSLGCYVGEPVTVINHRRGGCISAVKNGRYTIDRQLASAIEV